VSEGIVGSCCVRFYADDPSRVGRHGKPKRKILTCNKGVTELHWHSEHRDRGGHDDDNDNDNSRLIKISNIIGLRLGTEIDPTTSPAALEAASASGALHPSILFKVVKEKERLEREEAASGGTHHQPQKSGKFFGSIFEKKETGLLYGSVTLRRNCKAEELPLCFSLILPNR
jgi:hypothetical protein